MRFFTLLLLSITCNLYATGKLLPTDLQCEYLRNPLGIDALTPRLSWKSEARGSRAHSLNQSAYQILVASSQAKLDANIGDLWDSTRVSSSQSVFVPYAGIPLASGQACFWKVKIWDQDGDPSGWSKPACWSMGLLKPEDWTAHWIGMDSESADRTNNPVAAANWIWSAEANGVGSIPVGLRYFRRAFNIPADRTIKRAVCWMAGDNSFECFLNGTTLGSGAYHHAHEFDLTGRLRPGINVISARAENGGKQPNPAGLLALIRLEFTTGEPLVIVSDSDWRVAEEVSGSWQLPSFSDANWRGAKVFGKNGIDPWQDITPENGPRLPARMLRREFILPAKPTRAVLYASGLGVSEFYLNGSKVGDHVLSPGLTDYTKRVFYVTHDVTQQLRRGANCLGAILGNGRYYSPRPASSATYGFPRLLLQLRVEQEDGTVTQVVSDDQWRITTEGPIRANNEYDGEIYDARMEMTGWAEAGFDAKRWKPVELVTAPGGALAAQTIPPIRVTGYIKPRRLTEPRPGVFVYDLGQNMVGWCRLKVRGPRGTEITLRHAETVQPDGMLYLDNIRGAKVTDVYTLKGGGLEVWEPRFTYHGFRYVELRGYPGRPNLDTLTGCVVNDDLDSGGSFACSNPLLNQIYSNILWGVRGNYRSLPTDCPQRDERQGWLGDRSAEFKGETYFFQNGGLYAKWIQDMMDAQRANGSVSDVCPAYWPRYSDNMTWPSSLVIIPGSLVNQFGDTEVLARSYPAMKRWMNHMSGYLTNDLMFRDEYGDWCVPPEDPKLIHSQDPARRTAPGVLGTSYFYHCVTLMQGYARLLGKADDYQHWQQLGERVKAAFNREFYKADTGYYDNGSQTSCILALMFDLVPEKDRPRVFNQLVEKITHESKNHVGTGLIGGQWLMRTLSDNGRPDLAYTLAAQKSYPSWGYMIGKGATTLWELWNGDTADPAMNSQNHVMLAGDLIIWFHEYLAGIQSDPAAPGFRHIIMRPWLTGDLKWVRATHHSPYGQIASAWQRSGSKVSWSVTVPPNTSATLYFPCLRPDHVLEAGKPLAERIGIQSVEQKAASVVARVGSGVYDFTFDTEK